MMKGSHVLRVVFTVMLPWIRSNSALIKWLDSAFSTRGQHSFTYFSRYFGKRHEKELSSSKPFGLSLGWNSGIFSNHAFSTGPLKCSTPPA
uniref:Putative secreted protein n=1 Tax=Anopheles darlingi TaxID=43151 RepID=A0A2M4DKZ1_ANODA